MRKGGTMDKEMQLLAAKVKERAEGMLLGSLNQEQLKYVCQTIVYANKTQKEGLK